MRSPKRVSLLLRISRVGFPQTTTCVVVARVASKYLRMSYAGPVSLVLIVCWSCLKLSITDWNSDAMIMDFEKNCYHSPHTTTTRLGRYIPDPSLKRQIPGGAPPPIYG